MDYFTNEKWQEINEFLEAFESQDDRSCVIMIAARLEFLLERAIEARLLEPRSNNKDGLGHLQFSRCVSLCFRLGLIHQTQANALDALGQMQNKAAHFDKLVELDNDEFWQFIKLFALPWRADQPTSPFHHIYKNVVARSDTNKRALFVCTAILYLV